MEFGIFLFLLPFGMYFAIRWVFFSNFSLRIILLRAAVLGIAPFVAIETFILLSGWFLYAGQCYGLQGHHWPCSFPEYLQNQLVIGALSVLVFNACWIIIMTFLLSLKFLNKRGQV